MVFDLLSGANRAPAECVVELGGAEVSDLYGSLVEVVVDLDRSRAAEATLVFETRRLEDGVWSVQDDDRFQPWTTLRIEAVFGDVREEVMRGFVRDVKVELPAERGSARATISCQDESLALDRAHVNRSWGEDAPTSDGVIVQEIVQRHDLSFLEAPGAGQSNLTLNQNTTDIRFLRARAAANGYELLFREGRVYFGPWRFEAQAQATISVYAGPDTSCIRFDIADDGHQPDAVEYEIAAQTGSGSDTRVVAPNLRVLGKQASGSGGAGLDDFVWRPSREGQSDTANMEAVAQRMANEQSMKVVVEGELDGTTYGHVLQVAEPVGVDGVGDRHSGTYYVDTATHRFDVNGYRTTFRLLRNAYGDDLASSSNPLAGIL